MPDLTDELLLYQTLTGIWPLLASEDMEPFGSVLLRLFARENTTLHR
ncbi:hypothetical protein OQJ18_02580 [Fluoribacter dumoffii]|nr:hypothetical protein [Fluoribacter dumoffii]MCW8385973.1 hypothetical protein [Fluoribacter dumoffii]MCW8419025.1 hypothetical protein [Fluoribacter dumoffii]MCW8453131.1 hypothetical protein [Fluoribacter dumoffii]MCW8459651.1 hypothetical protein [Fluoribacter dumoffii]MCW8483008.1 hypothetical protein [Fluoribacter dumoffii]